MTQVEDLAGAVVLAEGVGAPADGGDDAEGAGGVHEDAEVVHAALGGGFEYPDSVVEETAHEKLIGRNRRMLERW